MKMFRYTRKWMLVLLMVFGSSQVLADLVYTPVNPSFGGNPLNGPYLLSNAQAQNGYEDPDALTSSGLSQSSAIEQFSRAIESRLLSDLLTNVEEGTPGRLETSDFIVEVISEDGGLSIYIYDKVTHESTQIDVIGF